MPPSAYDFSIRESLQNSRKVGWAIVTILFLCASGIAAYYLWPSGSRGDPTHAYYSDDDGQTYFTDSVYKFPPFDHDGKTAVEVVLAESGTHRFIGYLMRFTPEARKQLQQKYDDAVKSGLPVQRTVLDFMSSPPISLEGMEVKLPGDGHEWVPALRLESWT